MHLTALSHWSRSIGTGGRHASEPVDAITGMRTEQGSGSWTMRFDGSDGIACERAFEHRRMPGKSKARGGESEANDATRPLKRC